MHADFPPLGFLAPNRQPHAPPTTKLAKVRAITSNWLFDSRAVEIGQIYAVPLDTANTLVATGKAELVAESRA